MIGHGFEPEDLDGRRGKHRFGYWLIIVRAEEPPICLMPYTAWATLQILGRLYKIINIGLREVKMELEKLDKDKLINLIVDLYKNNKSAKEFFDFYVQPNDLELFKKYRDKVFEAFYPKRGFGYKLKDGKQAISDYKKNKPSVELVADLLLFYVETGVKFTNEFGDIDEGFYLSMQTTYVTALKLMRKENLLNDFAYRAGKVVSDSSNIGWGFHDYLFDAYSDFYADYLDDTD